MAEISWNPVLNLITELKAEYKRVLKKEPTAEIPEGYENCVEYWAEELGQEKYQNILMNLKIRQYGDLVIFRYKSFDELFKVDEAQSPEETLATFRQSYYEFWNQYDCIYRECRSVVIDVKNDKLVCVPLQKFFNMDERPELSEEIIMNRISTAKVVEFSDKLDGSMMSVNYYNGNTIVASSENIDPERSWRIADARNMIDKNIENMIHDNPDFTFVFEYISLKDMHIVQYPLNMQGLYLTGIRENTTGITANYHIVLETAEKYHVKSTSLFKKSFSEVKDSLDKVKCCDGEGYVANIDGLRVKIKYDDYLAMKHVLDKRAITKETIKAIADDKFDDIFSRIPENRKDLFLFIADKVYSYIKDIDKIVNDYYKALPQADRKTFMIAADKEVPKKYRAYVKNKYLGIDYNYLKSTYGQMVSYKSPADIGINTTDIIDEFNNQIMKETQIDEIEK